MPDKHAVLSASSSHRWLECPPSALLCSKTGDTASEFAMQGTDAHSLCEHKLKIALGQKSKDPRSNLQYFDEEMADCSDMYAQYVMEQLAAAKGEGEYKAGDHCQFCKVKATCRKRAEYNLELARYDFEMPSTLADDEIEAILSKVDALVSWAGDIKEYALQQAVSGKEWKIVEGRSNRKYVNETAVADTVKDAGYDPYEHKVLGVTAMTKLLGKTRFEELLSGFIEKPQGKPTLVPMSNKRPAMNTAANDFKEDK